MSELDGIQKRLDRLEARAEITELISAYALACDAHSESDLSALFTADAAFSSKNGTLFAKGIEQILAIFKRVFSERGTLAFHWTHDPFIRVDLKDPDRATGLVMGHAEVTAKGKVCISGMRYEDKYRRENGRWLFEDRVISFIYYVPVQEIDTLANPEHTYAFFDSLHPDRRS